MFKGNHKGKVLKDHKKVGQRLIPPLMQLPNMRGTSFRDATLPCLIWISAIFNRNSDRNSVNNIMEFITMCSELSNDDKCPSLAFLNSFNKLSSEQKLNILNNFKNKENLNFIRENTAHIYHLFPEFPLNFIFEDYLYGVDKLEAIEYLKEDVFCLLDRYCHHATKVQTTAFVSMAATGKMMISSEIDMPDFNAIFTDPESDECKKVASFVRASLNTGLGFSSEEGVTNEWAKSFWKQSFELEKCE